MKPGIKTTEFWITFLTAMVGPISLLLVATGVFDDLVSAEETLGGVVQASAVLVANITSAWAAVHYTQGRSEVKASQSIFGADDEK